MGKGSVIRKLSNHLPKESVIQIAFRLLGVDGGPGSGNFGHKGRPGLVGGSGPGGGKQYRGGRSDIGYFSSKKDWLNGLSGEKQAEATRLLKAAKEQIPTTSEKTPEEYIMQEWPIEWRQHFLNLVGEARSWSDRGGRLVDSGDLDKDEWLGMLSLQKALEDRYGSEEKRLFTDQESLNYDCDDKYGLMSDEEKEFYLDMKAKACGLPTSGKKLEEYSGPFQREIGYIDKAVPPKTPEENKEWIKYLSRQEREDLQKDIGEQFGLTMYDFSNEPNMNHAETVMIDKMFENVAENNAEEYISAMNEYLTKKDKFVNAEYFKNLANVSEGGIDNSLWRANRFAASALKHALKFMAKGDDSNLTIEKDGDILETKFLMDKSIPQEVRAAYLKTKANALGLTPDLEWRGVYTKITNYLREEQDKERKKKADEKKAQTLKDYNEAKKKNVVVIQGDSFSETINSMRNESGSYTHDEIVKIGTHVAKELEKVATKTKKKLDKVESQIDELTKKRREELDRLRDQGYLWSKDPQVFRDAEDKYKKLLAPLYEKRKELRAEKPIVDILKRVRQIGPSNPDAMKSHLPGRSTVKQYVSEAYNDYPREWVDISMQKGSITTRKVGRGYYQSIGGTIAISGWGDKECYETATHELGHRFEDVVPGIADAESVLYNKRTEGEKEESLRVITGNKGYRANEKTKKDKFINPYIGKVYNDNTYEIVSMGFQYAVHDPQRLLQDKEYANFILGLMAVG